MKITVRYFSSLVCFLFVIFSSDFSAFAAEEKTNILFLTLPAYIKKSTPPPDRGSNIHETILEWNGVATCLSCHVEEARQVFSSSHYQWLGKTPYMTNG